MSRRDTAIRFQHLLDYAREAIVLSAGRSRADLDNDREFNLALTRLLEILGEAQIGFPEKNKPAILKSHGRNSSGFAIA